jgi:hypothetical protein
VIQLQIWLSVAQLSRSSRWDIEGALKKVFVDPAFVDPAFVEQPSAASSSDLNEPVVNFNRESVDGINGFPSTGV